MLVRLVRADEDDRCHVALFGDPWPTTLCGEKPVSLGAMLPFNEGVWPDDDWCELCRSSYRADAQRHMT